MKQLFCTVALAFTLTLAAQAQDQYKIITVVESIVPGGLGRSRIIEEQQTMDAAKLTTERTDGRKSNQGDVKRDEVKIDRFEETKLLNFFSLTGINFQNIASNDAVITGKLNQLSAEGWELMMMSSGVESNGGPTDGEGIFITRFLLRKRR